MVTCGHMKQHTPHGMVWYCVAKPWRPSMKRHVHVYKSSSLRVLPPKKVKS